VDPQGSQTSEQIAESLPILVNIGDLLSYWTNGLLKSTVHRVIYPEESRKAGQDRYSIVYFCHPLDDASLIPIPSRIIDAHAASNPSGETVQGNLTAKDHLNNRLAATYGLKSGA
jgi:isopenicillin N synthase-like dioxygenase